MRRMNDNDRVDSRGINGLGAGVRLLIGRCVKDRGKLGDRNSLYLSGSNKNRGHQSFFHLHSFRPYPKS